MCGGERMSSEKVCYECGKALTPADDYGWLFPLTHQARIYVEGDPEGTLRCAGQTGPCLKQGQSEQRRHPYYVCYVKESNNDNPVVFF